MDRIVDLVRKKRDSEELNLEEMERQRQLWPALRDPQA